MELKSSRTYKTRFEDDAVREAILTFVIQRTIVERKTIWAACGLVLVACLFLLIQGNFSMAVLALIASCFPAIFSFIVWRVHSSSAFGRYKRMTDRSAQVTIDPEGFEIESNLGRGRLNWNNVTDIWERPKSFMLFSGINAFNILPRKDMPRDAQDFLSSMASSR